MISICQAEITEKEVEAVAKATRDGMWSGRAPTVRQFEEAFAKYVGSKYCVAVPNGTIALHLALRVLDIGPGDEVILPSETISSCMFAVHQLGATAVIVDVNKDTWCIDPDLVLKAITKKTKAIMPVHLYGLMADMVSDKYKSWRESGLTENNIAIIEDAAEAIGSDINGKRAGSIGDLGCFSLFFNKNVAAGEFGAITTSNDELNKKLRYFRDLCFGSTPETKFICEDLGFNYRPSGIIAALATAQLERADYLVGRRLEIHNWYKKYLSPRFKWQVVPEGYKNSYWMEAVLLPENKGIINRDNFMNYMKKNDIETRPCFPPLGSHPYISKAGNAWKDKGNFMEVSGLYNAKIYEQSNSRYIWENGVLLPSGGKEITEAVVKMICEKTNTFISE